MIIIMIVIMIVIIIIAVIIIVILILQTWKGTIYFTELAERVDYGKYDHT